LFVLATTGVLGLSAYAYLWFKIIADSRKQVIVLASLAVLLASSFFINSLFYPWALVWLMIILG